MALEAFPKMRRYFVDILGKKEKSDLKNFPQCGMIKIISQGKGSSVYLGRAAYTKSSEENEHEASRETRSQEG